MWATHCGLGSEKAEEDPEETEEEKKLKAEKKELVLESVVEFCSEPDLMVDLYTNYDADIEGSNLFEQLGQVLAAGTAAAPGEYSTIHQRSLDGGVALVDSIWQRFCNPATAAERPRERHRPTPCPLRHHGSQSFMCQVPVI